MDILSFFRPSQERQIAKAHKKVKEPHGDPAVRIGAARKLLQIGTPEAIRALLDRFTISASPSRQDEEEKQEVLAWIVSLGERAVDPILDYLRRERQIYWPARALKEILPPQEQAARFQELLHYHWENPPASPDPTAQLLRSLEGVYSEELMETVRRFLEHEDDDVCLAALECLLQRPEEEEREAVLNCYFQAEDRPRIRAYILDRLAEKGWTVRGYRPRMEESLPEGYSLTREGVVRRIGRKL